VNWLMESDVELSGQFRGAFANRTGNVEFSTGYVGVISVGYGYGNGFRAEIEGSYRANEVDSVSGFTGTLTTPVRGSGDAYSYGVMVNALYDFDMGASSFFHPYLGIGIGAQVHHYDNVVGRGANGAGVFLNDGEWLFAYQAIAGVSLPIASVPGLSVTAEYRFMGTQEASFDARSATSPNVVTRGSATADNFNHSLLVGLRYAFGVTPPPAPVAPAAAPAPARTFLVFFDFDRADLTDRARQIIAEAATNSQRAGTTRIEVSGHADTVGTPQYNQALSVRRANAVAAELERRGVARSAMTIQGFGFTRPLVPTGPQVREPQNRRVEIVLR